MAVLIPAEGPALEGLVEMTYAVSPEGLGRAAFATLHEAQMKTAWGRDHCRRYALSDHGALLAGARRYDVDAVLDQRPVRVCFITDVVTGPGSSARGHAREVVEQLVGEAVRDGADVALLFAAAGAETRMPDGFQAIPRLDVELGVAEPARYGAPMTMVRGGEDRDLAAIVAMGRARAERFRFHLDRDIDFVKHVITGKRLLAGLAPPGTRQLHFFIAEEGITAAAYVVISVVGNSWTLEECGDRDPAGARVGALLQALIAREPAERRPVIGTWLPAGFLPPQVTICEARPSRQVMMLRVLTPALQPSPLAGEDVLFWRGDVL